MKPLDEKGSIKILYVTTVAWFIAQGLKVLIYWFRNHKINFRLFVGTGGMPSSHSAFVCSLATAIGLESGWDSPVFLLSVGIALIIMSDAAGVRRAAGQQAKILNEIMDDLYSSRPVPEKKLKELLGHTPVQVFAGALLGIGVVLLMYQWMR
jgi:acid phosphatase family membrane protein YuiD